MDKCKVLAVILPILLCAAGYLTWFWYRLLSFYGWDSLLAALGITALCFGFGLIDPIPVKIRTVSMLYLGTFGILTDLLGLVLKNQTYITLHRSGALVVMLGATLGVYGYFHGKKVNAKRYHVPLGLDMRIVAVSDVHMGMSVDAEKLEKICCRIQAEKPDIFVILGDLCDDKTTIEEMRAAVAAIGGVKSRYGSWYVYGNHDLGSRGPALQYDPKELQTELMRNDVRILEDEAVVLDGFTLIGRRDKWQGDRKTPRQLMPENATGPVILLDHQPFDAQTVASVADIQLSGHTHAAQTWPLSWLGRLSKTFYGKRNIGDMTLITSSGLGCRGNTLRSGCSAEYIVVDLK